MREILFRGKRKENGEWVYGNYAVTDNNEKQQHFIFQNKAFEFEVESETIGQYTGLTDKNGKKIFEGDIVTTDIDRPYLIVEFRDGCFMFNCNDGGKDYYDIMLPITEEPNTEYKYGEIIGNIHDNPELLEEKE